MNYSKEAILFAEDLLKCIFEKRGLRYIPKSTYETEKHQERMIMSPFRLIMGEAVYLGINDNLHELGVMLQQQFKSTFDVPSFIRNVMKMEPDWFPEGYHPVFLIEFCVMVCFTALSYHSAGYHEISSCAGEVIAIVLTEQMLKGKFKQQGGWEKLVKESTELVILDKLPWFAKRSLLYFCRRRL